MVTSIKIAYQGQPGAYSDLAAKRYFKDKVKTCPKHTFEEMFEAVKNKKCDSAMVPIENSIAGSVRQNYDLLAKYDLSIVGEIYLRISHNLLVIPVKARNKTQRLRMIKKAYSHSQALLQCQKFFKKHPWIKPVAAEDTAGSAKDLSFSRKKDIAAIASSEAAKIYKLEILKRGIETDKNNFTRFVVIGKKQVAHQPRSLYKSLKPFAQRKINLTKIESLPMIGKPWEYLFYLDFEIDSIKKCQKAIEKLKENCLSLKILGFYKKGITAKS